MSMMAQYPYDRDYGHPPDRIFQHGYSRPSMDLPRPLEPRPTLRPSLSDSTAASARSGPVTNDSRSQYHNLPGFKDIFTEAPKNAGSAPHTPWHKQPAGGTYFHDHDGQPSAYGLHPPMVLHPPTQAPTYPQTTHTYEIPIYENSRVPTHPPMVLPPSPYANYPDSARDFSTTHPDSSSRPATSSYMSNGVHSPYGPLSSDDRHYSLVGSTTDRPTNSPFPPSGPESSKQYLGIQELAGEGQFHVYEGGYRIPTHVDGESVNPAWGLTKANKPRKRLALACLDCREKKIKCEPGANSCLQCEKAKRPCRRAPAQVSQGSVGTAPWHDTTRSPARKSASTSDPTPTSDRHQEIDILNKRRNRADPSPPNAPSKKHRSTSPVALVQRETSLPSIDVDQLPTAPPIAPAPENTPIYMTWDEDPYALRPDITLHLVELFFTNINSGVYWLHPRNHFIAWMKRESSKCQNERMVLYAMLASASVFAPSGLSGFGRDCARIAGDAVMSQLGVANVSVAQARMMLAFYYFSKGDVGRPWDHVGAAMRTIMLLRYHTEDGCMDDSVSVNQSRIEFGLSPQQLAECKRRTFWSCFLMDRLSGMMTCAIKPEDVFVRLPGSDDLYEKGDPSDSPFFPNENLDSPLTLITPASPLGAMAWTVLVAGVFGDVIDFICRIPYRPASTYKEAYDTFYMDIINRMQGWVSRLPPHLQYSEENLNLSIQQGYASAFICMHTLYHMAHMKLNQCLRHSIMPSDVITRNIREAHLHARAQLQIMDAIRSAKREIIAYDPQTEAQTVIEFSFSIPFPGYASLTAIDILAAGGPESSLQPTLRLIEGGLVCLRELSTFWTSAKDQLRACEKRYYQVKNVLTSGQKSQSGAWLDRNWGLDQPMERNLRPEDDCIYGLGDEFSTYFDAFAEEQGEGGMAGKKRALRIA